MPDYRLRIEAEYEAISSSLSELPSIPLSCRTIFNTFAGGSTDNDAAGRTLDETV